MEPVRDGDSLMLEAKVERKDSLTASKSLFWKDFHTANLASKFTTAICLDNAWVRSKETGFGLASITLGLPE